MNRIGKVAIVLGSLASPQLSQQCPAQTSSSTATAATTTSAATGNSVPPPRPFVIAAKPAQAQSPKPPVAQPTQSIPSTVSPAVGHVQSQPGQSLPQPMPGAAVAGPRIRSITEEQAVTFKPAPLEPTDLQFPINLATALRLADARPLIVAAAQASVWVAEAQLTRAKVLWVPQLNIGADYIRHDGGGPDFNKGIMTAPSVNFFYGGAGMWQNVALTDAYFQPLVSRQVLNSRQWDIQTAKNDSLLMVADTYFRVHQHRGMFAGALYAVERGHDLIERITQLSRELVPAVEVDRARNLVADLEQQATSSRENWRVQSANLTQILRLDPRAVVVPLEHDHLQVTLIDAGRSLDDLIPVGLTTRPELASQQALVQAVAQAIRRERGRMLLPSLLINGFQTPNEMIQAGIFGLGPNSSMNQWTGRDDLSYQLLWELEGFGIGNLARIKEQRGEQSKAIIELFKVQDKVAADVTRAQARMQSAAARVTQADRALRTAIVTFNGNFEGLRQTTRLGDVLVLVNRPQEAVFALQLLKIALDEYFTTVAEYNRAQFEMFHALGYPAKELTVVHTPGEVQPVNTERPAYLPHVGAGPPPATR
jgi:outer membrane protein TolC